MRTCHRNLPAVLCLALFTTTWAVGARAAVTATPAAPDDWLTPAERSDFRETPRHAETVAFCKRLAEASEWITYREFGCTPRGRALPLVVAAAPGCSTAIQARAAGKVVVLAQACIHPGECAGKDAMLMLLRDIAITGTQRELLEHVVLVVMPIFNADGHERFGPYSRINQNGPDEMGWRVTARNLNLNRDYLKADASEMRAWLTVWRTWQPDLMIDHHTTDGGDWQYDIMLATERHAIAAPAVVRWLEQQVDPYLRPALERDGHVPTTYFFLRDPTDPAQGIVSGGFGPRYSTGYAALWHRPAFLVETHMLKPYRTRVLAHYHLTQHLLEVINRDPQALLAAIATAEEATRSRLAESGPDQRPTVPLRVERTERSETIQFQGVAYTRAQSDVSGTWRIIYDASTPREFETQWWHELRVAEKVTVPRAYLVPPEWTDVIDVLRANGVMMRRLKKACTVEVEMYRLDEVSFPERPVEGRFRPKYNARSVTESRTFPAGTMLVPVDSARALLAVHLLEPGSPDSLLAWGSFNAVFERKEYAEGYILEALARQMLADDPALREEFRRQLAEDEAFAADPRARLGFFYERSPYWDQQLNLYPVARWVGPGPLPGSPAPKPATP